MARASHAAAARVVTPLAAHASPRVRAIHRAFRLPRTGADHGLYADERHRSVRGELSEDLPAVPVGSQRRSCCSPRGDTRTTRSRLESGQPSGVPVSEAFTNNPTTRTCHLEARSAPSPTPARTPSSGVAVISEPSALIYTYLDVDALGPLPDMRLNGRGTSAVPCRNSWSVAGSSDQTPALAAVFGHGEPGQREGGDE